MKKILLPLVAVLAILLLSSCAKQSKVAKPAFGGERYEGCELSTKRLKLDYAPGIDSREAASQCTNAACVFTKTAIAVVVVPVGSFLFSGGVVVIGNTLHWVEAQGRCDESTTQTYYNGLVNGSKAAGGVVLNTVGDAINWISGKDEELPPPPRGATELSNTQPSEAKADVDTGPTETETER